MAFKGGTTAFKGGEQPWNDHVQTWNDLERCCLKDRTAYLKEERLER